MAYESFPNSAHNGRAITLAEYEQLSAPLGLSGLYNYQSVYPVIGDSSGRQVKIRAGTSAIIRGCRFNNPTETIVPIPANASGNPRIDMVVLRMDREASAPNQFAINPVVIQGTAAASPVAPNWLRNETADGTGKWDIPLAQVAVANGATTITAANVTNRAWWVSGSGYVGVTGAAPPVLPGVLWFDMAAGIHYIGTITGTWRRVASDTGWVTMTAPSGWTSNPFMFSRIGDLVVMTARILRTGATLPNTVSPVMGTLGGWSRPAQAVYGTYHCSYPDHSSHVAIGADGTITFSGTGNGDAIGSGSTLYANMMWPAATA